MRHVPRKVIELIQVSGERSGEESVAGIAFCCKRPAASRAAKLLAEDRRSLFGGLGASADVTCIIRSEGGKLRGELTHWV